MTTENRPWMTALEMQFKILAWTRVWHREAVGSYGVSDSHVLTDLVHAIPFAWTADSSNAVLLAAPSIPGSAVLGDDLLPDGIANAFWWFDAPVPHTTRHPDEWAQDAADGIIDAAHVCALLITRMVDKGWVVSLARRMPTANAAMFMETIQIASGWSIDSFAGSDIVDASSSWSTPRLIAMNERHMSFIRFVACACTWLKQRIAVMTSGHIERHRRKQLQREFGVGLSEVKVVELRRALAESSGQVGSGEPVEWSCRWIVSGHWRNQYHPSTGKHELQYILPYVKGPEDRPLKTSDKTAYVVSR